MGEFLRQIKYKAAWNAATIIEADRFYPSSKTCSNCGNVKKNMPLEERIYKCKNCGLKMDRDLNAAINLKNMAVGSTVTACRPENISVGQEFGVKI